MNIILPSKLTKECWFYENNKELCEPHLGKHYISYSSVTSWSDYREDFIKQKFAGIKLPESIYGALGSYAGHILETGDIPEHNPWGFTGGENINVEELRPDGAEYERMILIDRGNYVIIGFIDRLTFSENGAFVRDQKTGGGNGKEEQYKKPDYIQTILYSHALELEGLVIDRNDVWFIRRTGSHIKPPLHISKEQFSIPLEYSPERVKYALNKVDKVVNEISDCYKTYLKVFG